MSRAIVGYPTDKPCRRPKIVVITTMAEPNGDDLSRGRRDDGAPPAGVRAQPHERRSAARRRPGAGHGRERPAGTEAVHAGYQPRGVAVRDPAQPLPQPGRTAAQPLGAAAGRRGAGAGVLDAARPGRGDRDRRVPARLPRPGAQPPRGAGAGRRARAELRARGRDLRLPDRDGEEPDQPRPHGAEGQAARRGRGGARPASRRARKGAGGVSRPRRRTRRPPARRRCRAAGARACRGRRRSTRRPPPRGPRGRRPRPAPAGSG